MEGLSLKVGGVYFDGTIGGGGHSYEILRRTSPTGRLIATDLDDEAIRAAGERLAPFAGRFSIYKANYKDFARVFDEAGVDKVDGALLDFGVSSHQIDDAERGFSYRQSPGAPGYAHEPGSAADGGGGAQHLSRRTAGAHSENLRRGALRADDRKKRRSGAGEKAAGDLRGIRGDYPRQHPCKIPLRGPLRKAGASRRCASR